jgi:hypothetical protein
MSSLVRGIFTVLVVGAIVSACAAQATTKDAPKTTTSYATWLKDYIPTAYAGVKVDDHHDWFQAKIADMSLTISWAEIKKEANLGKVEGLKDGKPLFVSNATKDESWTKVDGVTFYEGAGYYISGYKGATMGSFEVKGMTVVQFNGDPKKFVEEMAKARAKA